MRFAAVIPLLLLSFVSGAAGETFVMTIADDWSKLENAQAGDVVEIAPGTYQFRVYLDQAGTAEQPIVIRAQDPDNRPVWDLGGRDVDQWPGSYTAGDNHRGAWQVGGSGAYYQISGIEFLNAQASSSAGIRMINSGPVTLRDCLFRGNTNGLTGSSTRLVIEHCEFAHNGEEVLTGNMVHNLYVYGGDLEIRYSYFHDPLNGQNFHVRALNSVLEYNWFADGKSYTGDIMTCERFCGGSGQEPITQTMTLRGNVIIQGTPNNMSQILVLMHDETGGSNDDTGMVSEMVFNLISNTIIGTPRGPGEEHRLMNFRNDTVGTRAHLYNNIIYQVGTIVGVREPDTTNWSLDGSNNWISSGTDGAGLSANLEGSDPGFSDLGSLDLTLQSGSQATGAAAPTAGDPMQEYVRHMLYRARASAADLGAFELGSAGQVFGPNGPVGEIVDGGVDDGGPADGSVDDGGPADGSVDDGGPADGSVDDGGPADGSVDDGGPADGSVLDGGQDAGGSGDQEPEKVDGGCGCGAGGPGAGLFVCLLFLCLGFLKSGLRR